MHDRPKYDTNRFIFAGLTFETTQSSLVKFRLDTFYIKTKILSVGKTTVLNNTEGFTFPHISFNVFVKNGITSSHPYIAVVIVNQQTF